MKRHYAHNLSHYLFFVLLLLLSAGPAAPRASAATTQSPPPEVEVQMQTVSGKLSFDVRASIIVNADLTRSWSVLTGYDRMAQFVPNLTYSHVVARDGNVAIIAQHGFAKLLFLHQPIDLQLQATEYPMRLIEIHRINGNMRTYEARWEAQILPEGTTRIEFSGTIAPDFYVPSLFGTALMKSDLRATMEAVRNEIENNKDKQ